MIVLDWQIILYWEHTNLRATFSFCAYPISQETYVYHSYWHTHIYIYKSMCGWVCIDDLSAKLKYFPSPWMPTPYDDIQLKGYATLRLHLKWAFMPWQCFCLCKNHHHHHHHHFVSIVYYDFQLCNTAYFVSNNVKFRKVYRNKYWKWQLN